MRVLIIEDHRQTADALELMFKAEGFHPYQTDLAEEGVDLAKIYDYDLITMDLALPDFSGIEALRRIRNAGVKTPVIMLTGTTDMARKVEAFRAGADDYLTKPFHRDELTARAHAIIRRSKGIAAQVIMVGEDMTLNLDTKQVEVDGKRMHLTGKEYQMLELLALRKGTTLSKEQFLNHLYGGLDEPEIKIIDVFVCKLRKKLATATGGHHYISTIWGRGYVMTDTPEGLRGNGPGNGRPTSASTLAERQAAALASYRGQCLIQLALHGPWIKAATIAAKMGPDVPMPGVYTGLSFSRKHGMVESRGLKRDVTYAITEAGRSFLARNGWVAPAEAQAA